MAARRRLEPVLGVSPIPAELWVRTTDRYAEARGVIGDVEHSVDDEGIDAFFRPPTREPTVRRTPDQVRREQVSGCVEHALAALEGTIALETASSRPRRVAGAPHDAPHAARICLERAVNAVLVLHQLPITKAAGLEEKISLLHTRDAQAAEWVRKSIDPTAGPSQLAHYVVRGILQRLAAAPGMHPYIGPSLPRFAAAAARIPGMRGSGETPGAASRPG
jgi:hypothetical protein